MMFYCHENLFRILGSKIISGYFKKRLGSQASANLFWCLTLLNSFLCFLSVFTLAWRWNTSIHSTRAAKMTAKDTIRYQSIALAKLTRGSDELADPSKKTMVKMVVMPTAIRVFRSWWPNMKWKVKCLYIFYFKIHRIKRKRTSLN